MMKSIVKQFLSYRCHHPRRLFSTKLVTGLTKYDDDDNNVKEENSEDNDKHLKKISELEEEVKDKELIKIENEIQSLEQELLDLEEELNLDNENDMFFPFDNYDIDEEESSNFDQIDTEFAFDSIDSDDFDNMINTSPDFGSSLSIEEMQMQREQEGKNEILSKGIRDFKNLKYFSIYNFRNNATLRQQIKFQNQKIKKEKKIREEDMRVEEEIDDDEEEKEPDQKFRSFSQNQMAKKRKKLREEEEEGANDRILMLKNPKDQSVHSFNLSLNHILESRSSIHQLFIDFKEDIAYNESNIQANDEMFAELINEVKKFKTFNATHVTNLYNVFLEKLYNNDLPYDIGIKSFTAMIEVLVRIGLIDHAFYLFEHMETYLKVKPDEELFIQMTEWLVLNDIFLVNNEKYFLNWAKLHCKYKIKMDNITLHNVFAYLIRNDKFDVANTMLHTVLKTNKNLISWKDSHHRNEISSDVNVHENHRESLKVIHALADNKHYEAMEIMAANLLTGLQGTNRIDLNIVAGLVDVYGKVGKFNEGYEKFVKLGIVTKTGRFESNKAFGLQKEYVNSDEYKNKPQHSYKFGNFAQIAYNRLHDPHGCVALIDICGKYNDWEKALDIYYTIVHEANLSRTLLPLYIVNSIITACGNAGEWEIACNIYNDIFHGTTFKYIGKSFYLHFSMLNVLKSVETVDDDDLKLIVQEQIDEIMINMGNSIEKYRSHVDTNQSKLRLKYYQRDLNYTTYNAPNKFKNDKFIFMLQQRLLLDSFATSTIKKNSKKIIINEIEYFDKNNFPFLNVEKMDIVEAEEEVELDNDNIDNIAQNDGDDFSDELDFMMQKLDGNDSTVIVDIDDDKYDMLSNQLNEVEELLSLENEDHTYLYMSDLLNKMEIPYEKSRCGNSYLINPNCESFNISNIFKHVKAPLSSVLLEDGNILFKKDGKYYFLLTKECNKRKTIDNILHQVGLAMQNYTLFKFTEKDQLLR